MPNEENALILDYLATGKSSSHNSEPVAQVIGTLHYTLLEVVPKVSLKIMNTVYIGKDERKEIEFIKKRITFSELTTTAHSELSRAVKEIVNQDISKYLDFYNSSGSITIKRHQLELLPGLGKKHMIDILREREKKKFDSFEEITERVRLMPDPLELIVKRVLKELEGDDVKYYLFVRPPTQEREGYSRRPNQRDRY